MGKPDEDRSIRASALRPLPDEPDRNAAAGSRCRRRCRWRCLVAVALGLAVALSAVFSLPPFFGDSGSSDLGSISGAKILASFKLQRNATELKINISKLQYGIFDEIGVPGSAVVIFSMDPLGGSNWTNVVFGVLPYPENSTISDAGLSILRSYFESFAVGQSSLQLSLSLFGDPSFFQVLEFPGGITIIPSQSAFLLQKAQITFNFTLNFSIYQVQNKFDALKNQMRTGLHLTADENLYIRLTNVAGSTLAPPTIVEVAIIYAVGTPSKSRMQELAKSIAGSPAKNLGLNHTVFGKVKQIQLSSYFPHSSNNSSNSTDKSPSAAPQWHPSHQNHHHHLHHSHHHHQSSQHHYGHRHQRQHHHHHKFGQEHHVPEIHKASAPSPSNGCTDSSSGYQHRSSPELNCHPPSSPSISPPLFQQKPSILMKSSAAPAPAPIQEHSSLPSISFADMQPPSKSATSNNPPDKMLPSSCCGTDPPSTMWAIALSLYLVMQLL